jgi:hypothetical protein
LQPEGSKPSPVESGQLALAVVRRLLAQKMPLLVALTLGGNGRLNGLAGFGLRR